MSVLLVLCQWFYQGSAGSGNGNLLSVLVRSARFACWFLSNRCSQCALKAGWSLVLRTKRREGVSGWANLCDLMRFVRCKLRPWRSWTLFIPASCASSSVVSADRYTSTAWERNTRCIIWSTTRCGFGHAALESGLIWVDTTSDAFDQSERQLCFHDTSWCFMETPQWGRGCNVWICLDTISISAQSFPFCNLWQVFSGVFVAGVGWHRSKYLKKCQKIYQSRCYGRCYGRCF